MSTRIYARLSKLIMQTIKLISPSPKRAAVMRLTRAASGASAGIAVIPSACLDRRSLGDAKKKRRPRVAVWMVREFQKHTDGLPIPRSDIDGEQVDSCTVSFAARRPLPVARIPPDSFFCYGIPRKCRWPCKLGEKLGERELQEKNISTNSASKMKRKG